MPVDPASTNHYELGFTKPFFGIFRLDGNNFLRDFHNDSDDDTLLDTGVSFPIAFSTAEIHDDIPRFIEARREKKWYGFRVGSVL